MIILLGFSNYSFKVCWWHLLKRCSFSLKNKECLYNFLVELFVSFSYITHITFNSFSKKAHWFTYINISNKLFQRKCIYSLSNMINFNFFMYVKIHISIMRMLTAKIKSSSQKIWWQQCVYTEIWTLDLFTGFDRIVNTRFI